MVAAQMSVDDVVYKGQSSVKLGSILAMPQKCGKGTRCVSSYKIGVDAIVRVYVRDIDRVPHLGEEA